MGLQNSITVQFFKNLRRYILPKSILICTIAFSMMGLAKNAYAADYFFIGALDVEFDQSSLWPLNGGSASGPTPITKSPTNSWGSGDVANLGGGGVISYIVALLVQPYLSQLLLEMRISHQVRLTLTTVPH